MQRTICLLGVIASLAFSATDIQAAVTISSGQTLNMACSDGVCAPTANDAVLNVNDLETLLLSGNVEVTTTGSGIQAYNVDVRTAVAWSTASMLALDAYRSIDIGGHISIEGAGALSFVTDDGGDSGMLSFGKSGNATFSNLSGILTINGRTYTLVSTVALLASSVAADPDGNFALAASYDASHDGTYLQAPVATTLQGTFEGLGNKISNLTMNVFTGGGYVGLFADIGDTGLVENIDITNVSLTLGDESGIAGPLAGGNAGTVQRASASGKVINNAADGLLGGIIGENYNVVQFSDSTVNLVDNSTGATLGGLVGENDGMVKSSSASGSANGAGYPGGLVGQNGGTVSNSYANGTITVTQSIYGGGVGGGLVSWNDIGVILQSFASGSVVGKNHAVVGGLVGTNSDGSISDSYSTGSVTGEGETWSGGLLGWNYEGTVSRAYSTGAVVHKVHGSAGIAPRSSQTETLARGHDVQMPQANPGGHKASEAGGHKASEGGLVGYDQSKTDSFADGYWDTDTSGITNLSQGAGNVANDPGITGLTTQQFQSGLPQGFKKKVWAEDSHINDGLPYLLTNPPPK